MPARSNQPFLVATGDTSKTKLHKPLSEAAPTTPACKPTAEYRRVSERVGKRIIGVSLTADDHDWKCLRCFFSDDIEYGAMPE